MDVHVRSTPPPKPLAAAGDDGKYFAEPLETECDDSVYCGTGHRVGAESGGAICK